MNTTTMNEQGGNRWLRPVAGILAAGLLLGLTACATNRQVTKDIEPSGFLGDYSQLHEGTNGQARMVYIAPGVDWAKYTKIWLKPVELWKSDVPDSPMNEISPENQQTLIDLFHTEFNTVLSSNFTMVDHAGPDVLVIHSAITDANKSKPVRGVISSIWLPLKLISYGKQAITGTAIGVGSVNIEAEFLDGQSNQRVCAVVDRRAGTTAVRGRFQGSWGDVGNSFEAWAERLNTRLKELQSGKENNSEI